MSRTVPIAGRLLDLAGLALLAAGAACYARAFVGMRGLESYQPAPDAPPMAGMLEFDRLWRLSQLGVKLMVAGVVVFVAAAVVAWLLRRRAAQTRVSL